MGAAVGAEDEDEDEDNDDDDDDDNDNDDDDKDAESRLFHDDRAPLAPVALPATPHAAAQPSSAEQEERPVCQGLVRRRGRTKWSTTATGRCQRTRGRAGSVHQRDERSNDIAALCGGDPDTGKVRLESQGVRCKASLSIGE